MRRCRPACVSPPRCKFSGRLGRNAMTAVSPVPCGGVNLMAHTNDLPGGHDHVKYDAHEHHGHTGLGHVHAPAGFGRAFAVGMGLNSAFVVLEAGFGIASNSVALLADA